ncbi:hypothetical protein BCR32DRAFT_264464 [Anaeromyces robustus]|uniref:rRNA-processing protein FYV7 n=1 Tax=Anaeromyces robustus TaxID=1754192 RepID=A0A1Y1XN19_9FUNG|nr:hypothetical protein BCR32DRAFT_264464 [Anaeromyces robustus]|eukprot:ORX87122.1 hypothetical protein BCR32DRAFT_264464 [Anaeromyces robustus]
MNKNLGNTYKGKIIKKKHKLIEKAKIKSKYYKLIQNEVDDTPDYIKEIFGTDKEEKKEKKDNELTYEDFESDEGSNSETEQKETSDKGKNKNKNKNNNNNKHKNKKPNPFAKAIKERNKEREEKKKEMEEKKRIKEENLEKKKEYFRNRKSIRHKLARKNRKGQPIMKNQLEYLLNKLEK